MATTAIRALREERKLSLEALAFDAKLSVSQLSRIETDKRDPGLKVLRRIAKRLNVGVPTLIGEADTGTVDVPVISWVSAGKLRDVTPVTEDLWMRVESVAGLPLGDWIALEVKGDSMDRIAPEGALICVNRSDTKLVSGKFYVFSQNYETTTFKRWRPNPDRFQPFSTNPDNETIYPDGPFTVIGRVWRVINDLG